MGENIAAGSAYTTAAAVFAAWKASPGHNTIMLKPEFKVIGISMDTVSGLAVWYVLDHGLRRLCRPFGPRVGRRDNNNHSAHDDHDDTGRYDRPGRGVHRSRRGSNGLRKCVHLGERV